VRQPGQQRYAPALGGIRPLEDRLDRLLQAAHATRQHREDPLDQLRGLVQEPPEVRAIDDEEPEIRQRHDRRRSGLAIYQAHLAETVARPELAPGPNRSPHRRHAVDDDEERIPRIADPRDHRPGGNIEDLRELGDPAKLGLVEPAEERYALQMAKL